MLLVHTVEEYFINQRRRLNIFYYILVLFIWLLSLPIVAILMFKKKYKNSLPARFFLWKNPRPKNSKVYFHGASFGEIQTLRPIISMFDDKAVSVVTQTGYNLAKSICKNTRYLAFEPLLPFWLCSSKVLVVFEAELWLMLFFVFKKRKTHTMLINARISDHSYPKYKRFAFFYRHLFKFVNSVYAQTQTDAIRLESIGAKNIKICGNIKSAFIAKPNKIYKKPNKRLLVLASTHNGEEKIILDSIGNINKGNDLLLVVPRHPERFDDVFSIVNNWSNSNSLKMCRFSQDGFCDDTIKNCDVILVDVLGELINFYSIADIVILGGSFIKGVGGHNPIEPATFGASIISGEYFHNQKSLYDLVEGITISKADEIGKLLKGPLSNTKIIKNANIDDIIDEIRRESGKSI